MPAFKKGEWFVFCWLLLLMPCTAAGLVPHRGGASWSVEEEGGNYQLSVDIMVLGEEHPFWQSSFATKVAVAKPLTFRLKSGNGAMLCTVRLEEKGDRRFRLNYQVEAVVEEGEKPNYMQGKGSTAIILGRKVYVQPLGEMHVRGRLRERAQSGKKHQQSGLVLLAFLVVTGEP